MWSAQPNLIHTQQRGNKKGAFEFREDLNSLVKELNSDSVDFCLDTHTTPTFMKVTSKKVPLFLAMRRWGEKFQKIKTLVQKIKIKQFGKRRAKC